MAIDLSNYVIKKIYLDEIINDKGETVTKFDQPVLWWNDDADKESDDQ